MVLPIIGWREWVALPDLGIKDIKVKIDTGARSSALHTFEIERFSQNGKSMIQFKVCPYQRDTNRIVTAVAELIEVRQVRNSGGQADWRPVIQTSLELLGESWPIELTLTNRDQMGFRMLLGREAIRERFLIDSGKSYLRSSARSRRLKQKR
jgi:hypothetical protein